MRLSTILGVIQAAGATISIVMVLILSQQIKSLRGQLHTSGNDTSITEVYDTTIYKTTNKTVVQEGSTYYKEYDTTIYVYPGMCDSVRKYVIADGNDSIDIYGTIHTVGTLLDRDISYRWKLPYQKEITITQTLPKNGLVAGIDLMMDTSMMFIPGAHLGFNTKNNVTLSVGMFTNKTFLVSFEKGIIFDARKNKQKRDEHKRIIGNL